MKNFNEVDWAVLSVFFIIIVAGSIITYDSQQRTLFQQTYNNNLECRQALKDKSVSIANEICGPIPVIGDFVK